MQVVLTAPDVVLIEAGGGFGKTVLVSQVLEAASADSVRIGLPRRDPVDVYELKAMLLHAKEADSNRNPSPIAYSGNVTASQVALERGTALLAIDNAQSLTEDAALWVADLADQHDTSLRVIASGRTVPGPLAALEFHGSARRLDSDDLRLTAAECRQLVQTEIGGEDGERLWAALHHFSGGWLALLLLVVRRLSRVTDRLDAAAELLRQPAVLGQLIDYFSVDLDQADRDMLVQLAHFEIIDEAVSDAVGSPGLLRRLSQAGIPFAVGADGWWRLSNTVKDHLSARTPLDEEVARRAAPLLIARGAELAAARLLVDSGDLDAATRLVAELPTTRINSLDPAAFVRLVSRLGPAAEASPRVLLHLGRVYGNVGQLEEERGAIERARRAAATQDRDGITLEIEAESLLQQALLNETGTLARIESLLEHARPGTRAQARLLEAMGVALSDHPDEARLRQAENSMRQAAGIWGELGETTLAASVQRGLAVRVLTMLGKLGDAVDLLRRLGERSDSTYDRMLCLVFEARLLSLSGEGDRLDVVVHEAMQLAEVLGIDWVRGHTAWTQMLAAANRQDRPGVLDHLAVAEAHLGQLANDAGGLLFICEAADACATVGARSEASRLMTAAQARRAEDPDLVSFTAACLAARFGEADTTPLDELLSNGRIAPGLLWKAELLRGLGYLSAGDVQAASRALHEGLDQAARAGRPDLPDRREPGLLDALRRAVTSEQRSADASPPQHEYEVRVLGGFEIRRRGTALDVVSGRPSDLVKCVALAGGTISTDAVVEALWPEEAPGIGLRRLKNVLSRCRSAYGPLIVRDGRNLSLRSCELDLGQFESRAKQAATSRGSDRVAKAQEALDRFARPLLPEDVYEDWINQRREAVRRRVLGLVDVVLAADLESADLDDALRMLSIARDHDPFDQERPLRVAGALRAAGRYLEARSVAADSIASAEELGAPASMQWQELLGPVGDSDTSR